MARVIFRLHVDRAGQEKLHDSSLIADDDGGATEDRSAPPSRRRITFAAPRDWRGTTDRFREHPSSRPIFAFQPRLASRPTSRSLRGVPSGFVSSNTMRPVKPVTSAISSANWPMVTSAPQPTLTWLIIGSVAAVVALRAEPGNEQRCFGHVIDVEEFAPRLARPPHDDLVRAGARRVVEAHHQRRQDVTALGVKVIIGTVKVGRHHRAIIDPVLPIIAFAQLDARDLGDRIRLVGRLERPGQQGAVRPSAAAPPWDRCTTSRGTTASGRRRETPRG